MEWNEEVDMAYLVELSWHCLEGLKKKNPPEMLVPLRRLEIYTFWIQVNHTVAQA
jgi:hypothetical protein